MCLELLANNYIIHLLNPELFANQARRAEPLKHFDDKNVFAGRCAAQPPRCDGHSQAVPRNADRLGG